MADNTTTTGSKYNIIPVTVMPVLGVVSNALLLVAFIKDPLKCFRNSATYLVMNLAVSDSLLCLIAPLHASRENYSKNQFAFDCRFSATLLRRSFIFIDYFNIN